MACESKVQSWDRQKTRCGLRLEVLESVEQAWCLWRFLTRPLLLRRVGRHRTTQFILKISMARNKGQPETPRRFHPGKNGVLVFSAVVVALLATLYGPGRWEAYGKRRVQASPLPTGWRDQMAEEEVKLSPDGLRLDSEGKARKPWYPRSGLD